MSNIIYYTYKVEHPNGKYYVGRHSTNNINDGYIGSGKWVRQLKDTSVLTKTILDYFNTYEELCEAEEKLIKENLGKPNNMNFNNSSVGFATGDLNPAKSEDERARRSKRLLNEHASGKHVWSKTPNASTRQEVKEQRKTQAARQLKEGTHNFQNKETKERKKTAQRELSERDIVNKIKKVRQSLGIGIKEDPFFNGSWQLRPEDVLIDKYKELLVLAINLFDFYKKELNKLK